MRSINVLKKKRKEKKKEIREKKRKRKMEIEITRLSQFSEKCINASRPGRCIIMHCSCNVATVGIEATRERGCDGKDGRRGTYDKERRAPVATDDGDILATTTTRRTRRTRSATPLIAVVDRRLTGGRVVAFRRGVLPATGRQQRRVLACRLLGVASESTVRVWGNVSYASARPWCRAADANTCDVSARYTTSGDIARRSGGAMTTRGEWARSRRCCNGIARSAP